MAIDIAALIAHYEQQHGPGCASEQIAKDLLNEAQNKNDLPALLPLIEVGVSAFRRNHQRSQEHSFVPQVPLSTATATTAATKPNHAQWKKLFNTEIVVVPGLRMAWGDMTVDDHRRRMEYLQKKVDGTQATIDRHQEAIDLIVAAGVTCLRDVPGLV